MMAQQGFITFYQDTGTTTTPAVVSRQAGEFTITYEEQAQGFEQTITTVRIVKGNKLPFVKITRKGQVTGSLVFAQKKRTIGHYQLAEGKLQFAIDTENIVIHQGDDAVRVIVVSRIEGTPTKFDMLVTWSLEDIVRDNLRRSVP